ncbi:hypothetical protein CAEBREN_00442 [Caenorhabditis brenneri]|uniref:Uncharacterized protein n=1 Tax=Caenorhabditis brenneri TaxID=135651 RepID=G0NE88_CAEBE|nr:hypothetical protein CAEBREN_00442 [Caenorhabditis brenneri]
MNRSDLVFGSAEHKLKCPYCQMILETIPKDDVFQHVDECGLLQSNATKEAVVSFMTSQLYWKENLAKIEEVNRKIDDGENPMEDCVCGSQQEHDGRGSCKREALYWSATSTHYLMLVTSFNSYINSKEEWELQKIRNQFADRSVGKNHTEKQALKKQLERKLEEQKVLSKDWKRGNQDRVTRDLNLMKARDVEVHKDFDTKHAAMMRL